LIEFGGGLGLGSLLASAYCRCNIVYIDIDENIMADASKIASHLGLINVEYQLIKNGQIKFHSNAVLYSKDVIEHVYDLESLFQRLATSHTPSVHLTTANPCNNFRKKYFNQIHAAAENKPSTTHKSGQSYLDTFKSD
jgi:trans-aconitate methyltransferase